MNNQDYWSKRKSDEEKWILQNLKNDKKFNELIDRYYSEVIENMNDQINRELMSYAKKNGISLADAKKTIKATDIHKFEKEAKDIVSEARTIFKEKGSVSYSDFSKEVNERMKLYNATMRINRLEMLKSQLGKELVKSNIKIGKEVSDKLTNDYIRELRRQAGILGKNVSTPNLEEIAKIVSAQTGNANFSSRLWANNDVLKSKLEQLLVQQMITGGSPAVIAKKLKKLLGDAVKNAKYVTERLARTESARVQAQAQIDSFKKYGYDYCQWVAEPSACKVCQSIASTNDGVYLVEDVPYLPAHANCRCSLVAYIKQ